GLASDLLEARTGRAAVLAATRFCHERFDRPVAGWWEGEDPGRLSLVSVRGFRTRRRAHLRSVMGSIPRSGFLPQAQQEPYLARFRNVVGADEEGVSVLDAGS